MTIAKDHVVEIEYTLKNNEGEVLDTSEGKSPLSYLHGNQNLVPGLENELEGKKEGDQLNVKVEPDQGYGDKSDELVTTVPREELAQIPNLEKGMQLQAQTPQGLQLFKVMEVTDDKVTLDGNHPLAGQTLHFDVEVVGVRKATDDEIAHGHAHGADDQEH